jgi:hypothetical protein
MPSAKELIWCEPPGKITIGNTKFFLIVEMQKSKSIFETVLPPMKIKFGLANLSFSKKTIEF